MDNLFAISFFFIQFDPSIGNLQKLKMCLLFLIDSKYNMEVYAEVQLYANNACDVNHIF